MMAKLLITNYERNVLVDSYLLKNTPELSDIRNLLLLNTHISVNDVSPKMAKRIRENKGEWLRVTYSDFKKDKSKSPYYVKKAERFKCYFCNKPLTFQAYFVSDRDGRVFQVGSDCVKKIANPEFMINSQIAKTPEEQRRLEKLKANYSNAVEISEYKIDAIKLLFKLVIGKKELDKLHKIVKKCRDIVRKYISGKIRGTGDLTLYATDFNKYKEKLIKIHMDEMDTPLRLPTYILTNMTIVGQNSEAKKIYDNVSNNKGVVSNEVAIKIRDVEFLNWCLSHMLKFYGYKENKVTVSKYGEFNILVVKNRNNYWYKVDSATMLEVANYPKIKELSRKRIPLLKKGMTPIFETRNKLIADFVSLLRQNKFNTYSPDLTRLSDINYKKYSNNIYVKLNKGNLAIFSINDILNEIMLDYILASDSIDLDINKLIDRAVKITTKELTQQIEKDRQINEAIYELF